VFSIRHTAELHTHTDKQTIRGLPDLGPKCWMHVWALRENFSPGAPRMPVAHWRR